MDADHRRHHQRKGSLVNACLRIAILLLAITTYGCKKTPSSSGLPLIIDADTANEVDDLYAIVRAIQAPELDLLGITSAQFHISPLATDSTVYESQAINEKITRLMNRPELPLPLGANGPIESIDRPSSSEAADFIIEQARKYSEETPLDIAILGPCTNVATAIIQAPDIIPLIHVHYIGFWHDTTTNVYDLKEFNSGNDTLAVQLLLDTEGLDMDIMTATTCQHLVFEKEEVDHYLKGKGGIADYLVDRWEGYTRWWTKEDPEKKKWIMWDLAIIEALIHPEWAKKKEFAAPSTIPHRSIEAYIDIDVPARQFFLPKFFRVVAEPAQSVFA